MTTTAVIFIFAVASLIYFAVAQVVPLMKERASDEEPEERVIRSMAEWWLKTPFSVARGYLADVVSRLGIIEFYCDDQPGRSVGGLRLEAALQFLCRKYLVQWRPADGARRAFRLVASQLFKLYRYRWHCWQLRRLIYRKTGLRLETNEQLNRFLDILEGV